MIGRNYLYDAGVEKNNSFSRNNNICLQNIHWLLDWEVKGHKDTKISRSGITVLKFIANEISVRS